MSLDERPSTADERRRFPGWLRAVLIGRNPKRTLVRIVVLVVLCFVVSQFVLVPVRIKGPSMFPTYRDGAINFVNRLAYVRSAPQRGDVVGIRPSAPSLMPPSIMFMKRIVGLPGETVQFRNGRVLIDGAPLDEPYLKLPCDWDSAPRKLGANSYYVVGDNRSMPEVFHEEGVTSGERIVGKVLLCKNYFASSSSWR